MQGVRRCELGREVADKALGHKEIACAVAQPFATGAHGVEVQKSVLNLVLGKPCDSQIARQHGVHLKIGEIADKPPWR
jgi:hypothetical protein